MAISPKMVEEPIIEDAFLEAFLENNPSNWNIQPTEEDGIIEASCGNSREYFKGSLEEFNVRLRG
jgi:hypothetical protein